METRCSNSMRCLATMLLLAGAALPAAAWSQSYLNKAELTALLTGNTVHVEDLANGNTFMTYHDPAGAFILLRGDGTKVEGVWSARADGAQCVIIDAEVCARIVKNADGTYTRVVDGTPRHKWHKVVPGRGF